MTASPAIARSDAVRNRGRLLSAAVALIAERGADVDVREIAGRAGVGMGTLYRHFPTKRTLLQAALDHAFTAWAEEFRGTMSADPWADLGRFLDDALARQVTHPGLLDAYGRTLDGHAGSNGHELCQRRLRPLIADLVARAQSVGALRDDVTVEDVSLLLIALGRIAHLVPEAAWRRPLQVAMDGLRAPAATPMPVPAVPPDDLDAALSAHEPEVDR
jgi:AcrR family transcriptional regulator